MTTSLLSSNNNDILSSFSNDGPRQFTTSCTRHDCDNQLHSVIPNQCTRFYLKDPDHVLYMVEIKLVQWNDRIGHQLLSFLPTQNSIILSGHQEQCTPVPYVRELASKVSMVSYHVSELRTILANDDRPWMFPLAIMFGIESSNLHPVSEHVYEITPLQTNVMTCHRPVTFEELQTMIQREQVELDLFPPSGDNINNNPITSKKPEDDQLTCYEYVIYFPPATTCNVTYLLPQSKNSSSTVSLAIVSIPKLVYLHHLEELQQTIRLEPGCSLRWYPKVPFSLSNAYQNEQIQWINISILGSSYDLVEIVFVSFLNHPRLRNYRLHQTSVILFNRYTTNDQVLEEFKYLKAQEANFGGLDEHDYQNTQAVSVIPADNDRRKSKRIRLVAPVVNEIVADADVQPSINVLKKCNNCNISKPHIPKYFNLLKVKQTITSNCRLCASKYLDLPVIRAISSKFLKYIKDVLPSSVHKILVGAKGPATYTVDDVMLGTAFADIINFYAVNHPEMNVLHKDDPEITNARAYMNFLMQYEREVGPPQRYEDGKIFFCSLVSIVRIFVDAYVMQSQSFIYVGEVNQFVMEHLQAEDQINDYQKQLQDILLTLETHILCFHNKLYDQDEQHRNPYNNAVLTFHELLRWCEQFSWCEQFPFSLDEIISLNTMKE